MQMVKILIKKLNSKVKLPKYKTDGSSGMDIMAFIDKPVSIMPKKSELIPTGLSMYTSMFALDFLSATKKCNSDNPPKTFKYTYTWY